MKIVFGHSGSIKRKNVRPLIAHLIKILRNFGVKVDEVCYARYYREPRFLVIEGVKFQISVMSNGIQLERFNGELTFCRFICGTKTKSWALGRVARIKEMIEQAKKEEVASEHRKIYNEWANSVIRPVIAKFQTSYGGHDTVELKRLYVKSIVYTGEIPKEGSIFGRGIEIAYSNISGVNISISVMREQVASTDLKKYIKELEIATQRINELKALLEEAIADNPAPIFS